MDYKQFLQQSGKTELLSFFRRYESSMNKRKNYISPEGFYLQSQSKQAKEMGVATKQSAEQIKGGESVDDSKKA